MIMIFRKNSRRCWMKLKKNNFNIYKKRTKKKVSQKYKPNCWPKNEKEKFTFGRTQQKKNYQMMLIVCELKVQNFFNWGKTTIWKTDILYTCSDTTNLIWQLIFDSRFLILDFYCKGIWFFSSIQFSFLFFLLFLHPLKKNNQLFRHEWTTRIEKNNKHR